MLLLFVRLLGVQSDVRKRKKIQIFWRDKNMFRVLVKRFHDVKKNKKKLDFDSRELSLPLDYCALFCLEENKEDERDEEKQLCRPRWWYE